ncbi:MAG: hypothetical protein PSN04_04730 [Methyloprofundus sp.]|nr:hypothetical protein [Methyloprofundus sp.]
MGVLSKIFPKKAVETNIYRTEASPKKRSSVDEYLETHSASSHKSNLRSKKLTCVDRYVSTKNESGVELTAVEKDEINSRITARIKLRKSEESLMSVEDKELSGVAKYVESQKELSDAAALDVQPLTGVAKYLAAIISNKPVATGVAKYLLNRTEAKVSSVDRYVTNKALADKNKPKVVIIPDSSVTKYLDGISTMQTSRVAKYLAKKVVSDKQVVA